MVQYSQMMSTNWMRSIQIRKITLSALDHFIDARSVKLLLIYKSNFTSIRFKLLVHGGVNVVCHTPY